MRPAVQKKGRKGRKNFNTHQGFFKKKFLTGKRLSLLITFFVKILECMRENTDLCSDEKRPDF